MAVTYTSTAVLSGTSGTETIGAPAIEGAAANSYTNTSAVGRAFNCSVAYTGRKGCKITLAASVDVSAKRYLGFGLLTNTYNHAAVLSSVATGGLRIIFVDASGNYVGFNVYGSGIPNYAAGTSGQTEGFFTDYANDVDTTVSPNLWMIDRSAAPDISSGTMDWTQVASIELNANNSSSSTMYVGVGHLLGVDAPVMTGTETFASVVTALRAVTAAVRHANVIRRTPYIEHSASGVIYNSFIGLTVGNGSTATNLTDSDFSFAFINTYDKSPTYRSTGPRVLLDSSGTREFKINQSASDVLALSDGSFASAAYWQWVLSGSGTATLDRINFIRFNGFTAAHGVYTDCVWDGGEAAVSISTATQIVRGTVRNGVGHGIKITGAAGDYSDLDIAFDNNSTYDIELGAGGAGTYNLVGISAIGAYTIKIRNNSATNAITVEVPGTITTSTSTAGGSITISAPSLYQSVVINGLVAGSRVQIYDTTSSTELFNDIVAGTSTTWTDAAAAASDRAIRVRIAKVSGATAYEFLEANIGTCGTTSGFEVVTYLANQVADSTYNSNAVDGSAVTGITIVEGSTDRVQISIAGGSVSWAQIYAYQCYWLFDVVGITDDGAFIEAPDTANYILTGFKIKNTHASIPLLITGGYGVDSTGSVSALYDTTGTSIFPAPAHVVPYATGSGVTPSDITDIASASATAAATAVWGDSKALTVPKFLGLK